MKHGKIIEFSSALENAPDLFICSASYESRSMSIAKSIASSSVKPLNTAVVHNRNSHPRTLEHEASLESLFTNPFRSYQLDRSDPIKTADSLIHIVTQCPTKIKTVLVDITTFTRESLAILLKVFSLYLEPSVEVQYVYSHASEYSVGDPPESKWLSRGIREVRSILGYSGNFKPNASSHLILLAGFELERMIGLIRQYEPTYISIGVGQEDEKGAGAHWRINIERALVLIETFARSSKFTFPCYDFDLTRQAIEKQVDLHPSLNTLIAPMNTKVSTLSASFVGLSNLDVQLCYAETETYNYNSYSEVDSDYYLYKLPATPS